MAAIIVILLATLGLAGLYFIKKLTHPLRHIRGPRQYPLIGCVPLIDPPFFHHNITTWSKLYGPVYKISLPMGDIVVVNDYEGLREVLVTSGNQFAGRGFPFRMKYVLEETGILFSTEPDHTWTLLRKASQKHLKQFGDGMSHIEEVVNEMGQGMLEDFRRNSGQPYDPKHIIFDTSLNTLVYLILGVKTKSGDSIVENVRKFESDVMTYAALNVTPGYVLFDIMPWLRFFARSAWSKVEGVKNLQKKIWEEVQMIMQEHPEARGLVHVLKAHTMDDSNINGRNSNDSTNDPNKCLTDNDIQKTIVSLLWAGVATTSTSFYATINIFAHRTDVQSGIWKEISENVKPNCAVTLDDRQRMPYTRAVLLEVMRYLSTVVLGGPHRTICDSQVNGINIPKDTVIMTNLWGLHRDPNFWDKPEEFLPHRFLDSAGELVPPDHPNRKHLMPFGAGPRVCLGEALAMARLFLWTSSLVQRYEIVPAEGNLPTSMDARNFIAEGAIRVARYKVCLLPRKQ